MQETGTTNRTNRTKHDIGAENRMASQQWTAMARQQVAAKDKAYIELTQLQGNIATVYCTH